MKKFLTQITIFSSFPIIIFSAIFIMADGYTDGYYNRFRSPDQSSLILGTSRAAQGLKPSVFDNVLTKNKFFNYSFTQDHSPYGPIYFESIKRKLDHNTSNGIFILSVDPWSLSSTASNPDDVSTFRENGRFLDNLNVVSMNPNIFYLINEYQGSYLRILLNEAEKLAGNPRPKPVYLQEDGWLDIEIPMDSASVQRRTESKFEFYREENLPTYKKSNARINALKEIISYLEEYGSVFLIRLPVPETMIEIESELYPGFDEEMQFITNELDASYLSLLNKGNAYTYTDGNHLYKSSAEEVSSEIALWIKSLILD